MAALRELLASLGYTDVATLLNSGNAVFRARKGSAAEQARTIAAALAERLQVDVPVIVKSASELSAIVAENPIAMEAPDHARFLVAFAQDAKALADLAAIESLVLPPERFALGSDATYLL
jgi:uncharacterized protein (DUF1697 family)